MRSLYLRIYLTVVAALALFALASGWLVQRHVDAERERFVQVAQERAAAWADLLQRSLPGADAPRAEQAAALAEWSERLRVPLALDDSQGRRIGASPSYQRLSDAGGAMAMRSHSIVLVDGRTLWILRPPLRGPRRGLPIDDGAAGRGPTMGGGAPQRALPVEDDDARRGPPVNAGALGRGPMTGTAVSGYGAGGAARDGPPGLHAGAELRPPVPLGWPVPWLSGGIGLAALLLVLFVAVAGATYPVVRRLTRRLEALQRGVEAFGAGALQQRVAEDGKDEVAAVAASFNRAAGRIEALLNSHRSLLANASHELRSPLARLKMAVAMIGDAPPAQRDRLRAEIDANVAELDALVEEVLLASRLDAGAAGIAHEPVELLALAAEEAARSDAGAEGETVEVSGDERLLRRAIRNMVENAHRYGGGAIEVQVRRVGAGLQAAAEVAVCDRGPGVPEAYRERIFEPFFRVPGHAEREGGIGLGLALVRQIAERHGGSVRCEPRDGGGSRFVLSLPLQPRPAAARPPA